MPLIKTQISDSYVSDFLHTKYSDEDFGLQRIKGGELSQAFSYTADGQKRIIRFNIKNQECFVKDKVCFEMFSKYGIPIPKILEIGQIQNYYYAISQLAAGQTLDKLSAEQNAQITPQIFEYLLKIWSIPVTGSGYGVWDSQTLNAPFKTAVEWLLVDIKPEHWKQLSETEKYCDFIMMNSIAAQIEDLKKYIPQQRYLVHGDFGFSNTLSDGQNITGIIDWTESMYGDFVFDLCWLQFWSESVDYLQLFAKFNKTMPVENYDERCRLYLLLIGLTSMEIFAESRREKDYLDCVFVLKKLKLLPE
jgi:hygromycin-B 4-O-kinase